MMPSKPAEEIGKEMVFKKLGKSLIAYNDIQQGEKITIDNLSGRIFNTQFIPVRESNLVIGLKAKAAIKQGEPIHFNNLYA